MHDPVQVTPCLHAMCAGCLSEWFEKQKDCPTCRKPVITVAKAFQAKSAIDMLLEAKPGLKRDPSILAKLDKQNIFTREQYVVENEDDSSEKFPKTDRVARPRGRPPLAGRAATSMRTNKRGCKRL